MSASEAEVFRRHQGFLFVNGGKNPSLEIFIGRLVIWMLPIGDKRTASSRGRVVDPFGRLSSVAE